MHALLPLIKHIIDVSCRSIYVNTNLEVTYYLIKYNVVMNILRFFIFSRKHDSWYNYFAITEYRKIRLRHLIPVSIVRLNTAIILLHK